jgi:hypothetical protein
MQGLSNARRAAPGKALDEEDVQYFDEVRRRKEKRKAKEREQEEIALKAFRQATLTASSAGSEAVDPASTHTKRRPSPEQHAQSAAQGVPSCFIRECSLKLALQSCYQGANE